MRASVPCSMPFARLTTGTRAADDRPRLRPTPRATRATARRAPRRRRSVARLRERRGGAQRRRAARRREGTRGSRACRRSPPRAPAAAPTTPSARSGRDRRDRGPPRTRADHRNPRHADLRCVAARLGIAPPPRVVAGLGALRIDLAGARHARRDRVHDALRSHPHVLVGADRQRLADHRHLRDTPLPARLAALHQDAVRPPQTDRHDGNARLLREARGARLPAHRLEVERDRAFGKHRDALAAPQRVDGGRERLGRVGRPRFTGIWCAARSSEPSTVSSNSSALAR